MPSSLITNSSNSIVKTSSANAVNNIGAAAPILQGLMEGRGLHNPKPEILVRDQENALIVGRSRQAAANYDVAPTAANRAEFITALTDVLADLEAQRDYAQAQQRQYMAQTEREAKAQASYPLSWRAWLKSWVVATPQQLAKEQARKYAAVAAARQQRIDQLQPVLLQLTAGSEDNLPQLTVSMPEAKAVKPEGKRSRLFAGVTKQERSTNRQPVESADLTILPDPTAMPLSHARQLLQQSGSKEFRVNSYTLNQQSNPSVGVLNNGDFVIAWDSYGQDGGRFGVYAQRYAADGTPQGNEFQVNTYTADMQYSPRMGALSNGDFVISWTSTGQDGDGYGVYAQRYATDGRRQGGEFRVNTYTLSNQTGPRVAVLSNDDFVVAWNSNGQDGDGFGVYAQRYAAEGTPQGSEFRVNTYTLSNQSGPRVAALSNGDFVVAWHSNGQDGDGYGVYAQRYTADGTRQGSEFRVNTYTTSDQEAPSVSALSNGDFVVAWNSDGQEGSGLEIYAQRYAADGTPQGSEFQVNTYMTNHQSSPSASALSNGGFVVAWESNGQDSDGYGVYAQRYAANGTRQEGEFQVNTYTTSNTYTVSNQWHPSVGGLNNGGFVITWWSYDQDGDGYDVYARLCSEDNCRIPEPPEPNKLNIALIAGVASSAGLAVLCLVYALYRYRKKQQQGGNDSERKAVSVTVVPFQWPVAPRKNGAEIAEADQPVVNVCIKPAERLFSPSRSGGSTELSSSRSLTVNPYSPAREDNKHARPGGRIASSSHPRPSTLLSSPLSPSSPSVLSEAGEITFNFNIHYSDLKYNQKNKLGAGAYGTVYKGTYQSQEVAIKKLNISKLNLNEGQFLELRKEAGIMGTMRSNFIVQLQGVCMQAPNFCLVMELMPKGSLYDVLRNGQPLAQSDVYNIAMDVAYGLRDLHKSNVLHRDLKSLNVLLDDRMRAKIGDFGLSKIKSEMSSMSSTQNMKGTAGWMAPEQFGEGESAKASKASDMYSYGMVLWEMLNKPYRIPFKGVELRALGNLKKNRGAKQETIPADCPAPLQELVMDCWQPEAKQRPSAQAVAKSLGQLFSALSSEAAPQPAVKVEVVEAWAQSEIPDYVSNLQSK